MFNTYSNYTNKSTIKINATTGGILKNHPSSWFERFNLKSIRSDILLHKPTNNEDDDVIILQMVICGDMEVIAECVTRKDYESWRKDLNNETKEI